MLPQRKRTPRHITQGRRIHVFRAFTAGKLGKNGVYEETFERTKERECSTPDFSGFHLFTEE
jgi:hypothetical protein